jgi:hypothetical protein
VSAVISLEIRFVFLICDLVMAQRAHNKILHIVHANTVLAQLTFPARIVNDRFSGTYAELHFVATLSALALERQHWASTLRASRLIRGHSIWINWRVLDKDIDGEVVKFCALFR